MRSPERGRQNCIWSLHNLLLWGHTREVTLMRGGRGLSPPFNGVSTLVKAMRSELPEESRLERLVSVVFSEVAVVCDIVLRQESDRSSL